MTDFWPGIITFHLSFTDDMHRLLSEALMWPVLAWLAWTAARRVWRAPE